MNRTSLLAAAALLVAAGAAQAAGTVQVKFTNPNDYIDAGRGSVETARTTEALAGHFKALAKRLPAGHVLDVEVLDIDLAGELRWTRAAHEIRVVRGRADWPRIALRYTLSQDGRTISQGQVQVSDMGYLQTAMGRYQGEAYAYERRMLDRWVQDLVAGKAGAH